MSSGNALWSGVANMRKIGLKIALLTISMLIYTKLTYSYSKTYVIPKNLLIF